MENNQQGIQYPTRHVSLKLGKVNDLHRNSQIKEVNPDFISESSILKLQQQLTSAPRKSSVLQDQIRKSISQTSLKLNQLTPIRGTTGVSKVNPMYQTPQSSTQKATLEQKLAAKQKQIAQAQQMMENAKQEKIKKDLEAKNEANFTPTTHLKLNIGSKQVIQPRASIVGKAFLKLDVKKQYSENSINEDVDSINTEDLKNRILRIDASNEDEIKRNSIGDKEYFHDETNVLNQQNTNQIDLLKQSSPLKTRLSTVNANLDYNKLNIKDISPIKQENEENLKNQETQQQQSQQQNLQQQLQQQETNDVSNHALYQTQENQFSNNQAGLLQQNDEQQSNRHDQKKTRQLGLSKLIDSVLEKAQDKDTIQHQLASNILGDFKKFEEQKFNMEQNITKIQQLLGNKDQNTTGLSISNGKQRYLKLQSLVAKSLTQQLSLPEQLEVFDEISKTLETNSQQLSLEEKYNNLLKIQEIVGLNPKVYHEYVNQQNSKIQIQDNNQKNQHLKIFEIEQVLGITDKLNESNDKKLQKFGVIKQIYSNYLKKDDTLQNQQDFLAQVAGFLEVDVSNNDINKNFIQNKQILSILDPNLNNTRLKSLVKQNSNVKNDNHISINYDLNDIYFFKIFSCPYYFYQMIYLQKSNNDNKHAYLLFSCINHLYDKDRGLIKLFVQQQMINITITLFNLPPKILNIIYFKIKI